MDQETLNKANGIIIKLNKLRSLHECVNNPDRQVVFVNWNDDLSKELMGKVGPLLYETIIKYEQELKLL